MVGAVSGRPILLATGDIYLGTDDAADYLAPLAKTIGAADIVIGNLEGPVSERGTLSPEKLASGSRALRMHPRVIDLLKSSGFHAVSLANNHCMDFGAEALCDTLDLLDRAGIARAGGGRTLNEARSHAIIERAGLRIALVSMTWLYGPVTSPARDASAGLFCVGADTSYLIPPNLAQSPGLWPRAVTTTRPADRAAVLAAVAAARKDADLVVAACHWGVSSTLTAKAMGVPLALGPTFLTDYQIEMGHAIVDAGADLIIGHHPHRLQGVERYRGAVIAYSLGNFLFSYQRGSFGLTAAALKVKINPDAKRIADCSLIPLVISDGPYRTRPARGREIAAIADHLSSLSQQFDISMKVENGEIIPVAA